MSAKAVHKPAKLSETTEISEGMGPEEFAEATRLRPMPIPAKIRPRPDQIRAKEEEYPPMEKPGDQIYIGSPIDVSKHVMPRPKKKK